ncbi:Protein nud1 [Batrachochytrium dendrobatidis]|nr:Protein nud1 [Batrachochytrium dendrobatidis]
MLSSINTNSSLWVGLDEQWDNATSSEPISTENALADSASSYLGTVVVRDDPNGTTKSGLVSKSTVGSITGPSATTSRKWPQDTAHLSELFGPSSLERLFQDRRPQNTESTNPLHATAHGTSSADSNNSDPFTNKLFGEQHDTWTKRRLSALMSELHSSDNDKAECPTISTRKNNSNTNTISTASSGSVHRQIPSERDMFMWPAASTLFTSPTLAAIAAEQSLSSNHATDLSMPADTDLLQPATSHQIYPEDIDFLDELSDMDNGQSIVVNATDSGVDQSEIDRDDFHSSLAVSNQIHPIAQSPDVLQKLSSEKTNQNGRGSNLDYVQSFPNQPLMAPQSRPNSHQQHAKPNLKPPLQHDRQSLGYDQTPSTSNRVTPKHINFLPPLPSKLHQESIPASIKQSALQSPTVPTLHVNTDFCRSNAQSFPKKAESKESIQPSNVKHVPAKCDPTFFGNKPDSTNSTPTQVHALQSDVSQHQVKPHDGICAYKKSFDHCCAQDSPQSLYSFNPANSQQSLNLRASVSTTYTTLSDFSPAASSAITPTHESQKNISSRVAYVSPNTNHVNLSGCEIHSVKNIPEIMAGPKRLTLDNNQITFLSDLSTSTEILHISNNLLSNITSFSHLSALRVLDISRNDIFDISAVACLRTLVELDVSFNKIINIGPLLLLSSLSNLRMGHNQIESLNFQFSTLERLHYLDVSYNNLKRVKYLHRLLNLQDLNLECNYLRSFSVSRPLHRLRCMNVSYNRLVSFGGSSFPGLIQLKLDGNCIPEIDEPEGMCSLEILSIEDQRTDDLILFLTGYDTLKELRISGNTLDRMDALTGPFMEAVECRNAGIQSIPPFTRLAGTLWRLCLCGNQISDISSLAALYNLQILDMSNNKIAEISGVLSTLRKLSHLRTLDLRGNPITEQFYTDCELRNVSQDQKSKDETRECTAQAVREVCYRSAVISAIGKTIEILDLISITRQDQIQARKRMVTLKQFMRDQQLDINQQPMSKSVKPSDNGRAKVDDPNTVSAQSNCELESESMTLDISNDQSMMIQGLNSHFEGWTPQSYPLDDVTMDDRLFFEIQ